MSVITPAVLVRVNCGAAEIVTVSSSVSVTVPPPGVVPVPVAVFAREPVFTSCWVSA